MHNEMISINLVYEDELQKAVMLRIMGIFGDKYYPGTLFSGKWFWLYKKEDS